MSIQNDVIDVTAGVAGGIVVTLTGHPFDTTKTRLQTAPPGFYSGTLDCVKKTVKWEGIGGFYTGIQSPLAGQMFYRACSFGSFYHFSRKFSAMNNNHDDDPSMSELFLAGAVTGFTVSVVESPIDLMKTKLQVQVFGSRLNPHLVPQYTTLVGCIRHTLSHSGIRGLYQGLSGTMIRNTPANSMFFPVNELIKQELARREGIAPADLTLGQKMFAGASAGLSYWVAFYPLDVIKSQMQSVEHCQRQGWLATARHIYRSGGLRAFSKGLVPCAARSIPACSSMFATVDYVRNKLQAAVHT